MLNKEVIIREKLVSAQHYHPLPVALTRGKGVYLWDVEGRRYLDMMSAYSAVSHGHCHPKMVKVAKEQIARLCITSQAFHTDKIGPFFELLCEVSFSRILQ